MNDDIGTWALVDHYLTPLKDLFGQDGVTEICVNRFDDVWIEKFGELEYMKDIKFEDEATVATTVTQIANALGQPVDNKTHPILDARLKDGTRVCAVLYPTSSKGTSISFRVFPKEALTVKDLLEYGTFTEEMLEYMKLAIQCHFNILVSGSTGSGKTTILNVLSSYIPDNERVLTAEDTQELKITAPNWVALEAPTRRQNKNEDFQTVDLNVLIRTCLRKNPNRIIVGEIRDAEAAMAFLQAINTGHTASSTIHANDPHDALERIQTLIAGSGSLPFQVVEAQVRSNLNLIIHAEKTPHQGRRITSIAEIQKGEVISMFEWSYTKGKHIKTNAESELFKRYKKYCLQF